MRNREGDYKIRSNEKLIKLFSDTDIEVTLKSQRLKWARHLWMTDCQIIRNETK